MSVYKYRIVFINIALDDEDVPSPFGVTCFGSSFQLEETNTLQELLNTDSMEIIITVADKHCLPTIPTLEMYEKSLLVMDSGTVSHKVYGDLYIIGEGVVIPFNAKINVPRTITKMKSRLGKGISDKFTVHLLPNDSYKIQKFKVKVIIKPS